MIEDPRRRPSAMAAPAASAADCSFPWRRPIPMDALGSRATAIAPTRSTCGRGRTADRLAAPAGSNRGAGGRRRSDRAGDRRTPRPPPGARASVPPPRARAQRRAAPANEPNRLTSAGPMVTPGGRKGKTFDAASGPTRRGRQLASTRRMATIVTSSSRAPSANSSAAPATASTVSLAPAPAWP